jgi:hypothetical protein
VVEANLMKKLIWTIFVLIVPLIFIGLSSCIETGDEERPGMAINSELLSEKVWEVDLFKDDGQDKTGLFADVFLEFRPSFVFRVTHGCDVVNGEWVISNDSSLLVIRLPDNVEPLDQLEDEWVITWMSDTEMHIVEQDDKGDEEFHLKVAPLQSLSCQSCEELSHELIKHDWSITSFSTQAKQYTEESRGGFLDFEEDGEVVFHINGETITGSWALVDQCQTLVIQWLEDNSYADLYLQLEDHWIISGIDQNTMVLESNNANRLELSKGRLPSCEVLHGSMVNTSWSIDFVSINDDDVSENFLGSGLSLLENNQLATDVFIGPAVLGQWILSGNCDQLTLQIEAGQLKELSKQWVITELTSDRITLSFEEGALSMQMRLVREKPEPTQKCLDLLEKLKNKHWSVKKFVEDGSVVYNKLQYYKFQFMEDGQLLAYDDQNEIYGTWYPTMNCGRIVFQIEDRSVVTKLNGNWQIEMVEEDRIILVYEKTATSKTVELIVT